MKKTNFFVQKSYAIFFALTFVLFGISAAFNSANAQLKSPLPKLVPISEAFGILTAEMEDLAKKSNGDPANLTADETQRMRIMGVILGDLQTNKDVVGYQTEFAVHLYATDATYQKLVQSGVSTIEVDPYSWIYNTYKSDKEYYYVVNRLKI
jgi:hypothetical protein